MQGSIAAVFQSFIDLWQPMWQKHADEAPARWTPFVESLIQTVPQVSEPMPLPAISADQWIQEVRKKKPTSATGPDGVSRLDLLSMPPALTQRLVDLVNQIDQGQASWPTPTMVGHITSVVKHEHACGPQDFRPITVLSLVYRVWSSIRAKQCLLFLDRHAPEGVKGHRPGHATTTIWWQVSQQIEAAALFGQSYSGFLTDICKAFNTLPRPVVWACARRYGLPLTFVRTWDKGIAQIQRHFICAGACSEATFACTGYPEGDPMSVVAMLLINCAMHNMVESMVHPITTVSFVDNWEARSSSVQATCQAFSAMESFTQMVDIKIDVAKTSFWAVQPADRAFLCQSQKEVAHQIRDLGGHLNFTRRFSNQTVRLKHAWAKMLGAQMSLRKEFEGLQGVDLSTTLSTQQFLGADARGLLRTTWNGTDSVQHRVWECEAFTDLRTLPSDTCHLLAQQPACTRLHGWIVEDGSDFAFRKKLLSIPDTTSHFEQHAHLPSTLHLFTDGGCKEPTVPVLRLGTWSVSVATLDCASQNEFQPVSAGGLPGLFQTTLRSEITAVTSAFRFGLWMKRPFYIWTDNQTVYDRLVKFARFNCPWPRLKDNDHDLWTVLHGLVCQARQKSLFVKVVKVVSHQNHALLSEAVERWACTGNDHADRQATLAFHSLPSGVQYAWTKFQAQWRRRKDMCSQLHTMMTNIALRCVTNKSWCTDQNEVKWDQAAKPSEQPESISLEGIERVLRPPEEHSLGRCLEPLHAWLVRLTTAPNAVPLWLCSYQLYLHFQATTSSWGFTYQAKEKLWVPADAYIDDKGYDFLKLPGWHMAIIKAYAKAMGLDCDAKSKMPWGGTFRAWQRCLHINASPDEFFQAWFNLLPFNRKNFFLEAKRPCVICLTEKEHTLVPPHAPRFRNAPNVPSEAVEDHRFCTDCWEDFLRHARNSTASSMTCPVCRGEIIIPEVWTQRLQLPQQWSQEEAPATALLPLPVVTVPRYERSRWLFRRPSGTIDR
eukprot:s5740_g1.t1